MNNLNKAMSINPGSAAGFTTSPAATAAVFNYQQLAAQIQSFQNANLMNAAATGAVAANSPQQQQQQQMQISSILNNPDFFTRAQNFHAYFKKQLAGSANEQDGLKMPPAFFPPPQFPFYNFMNTPGFATPPAEKQPELAKQTSSPNKQHQHVRHHRYNPIDSHQRPSKSTRSSPPPTQSSIKKESPEDNETRDGQAANSKTSNESLNDLELEKSLIYQ